MLVAINEKRSCSSDESVDAAETTPRDHVRGGLPSRFRSLLMPVEGKIAGVTGVILAGGESRRMGSDKSLLPFDGDRFIERIHRCMAELFEEVIVVTNSPGLYGGLPCRLVPDLYPDKGSLVGIHSGLHHSRTDKAFVVACDMPFLSAGVIRRLCAQGEGRDVVVPCDERCAEPLHALYDRRCITVIAEMIEKGEKKIDSFFPRVRVHEIPMTAFADCDPEGRSFSNINTPEEYFALRCSAREDMISLLPGEAACQTG